MEIAYAPSFIRKYKSLPESLKQEVKEKIILFLSFLLYFANYKLNNRNDKEMFSFSRREKEKREKRDERDERDEREEIFFCISLSIPLS